MSNNNYRDRLIAARQRIGLSRRAMAQRLLTPRMTYTQWEDGARRTPGAAVIAAESIARRQGRRLNSKLDQVLALADGTRTAREIAAQTGQSETYVRNAVSRDTGASLTRIARKYDAALLRRAAALVRSGQSRGAAVRACGLSESWAAASGALRRALQKEINTSLSE